MSPSSATLVSHEKLISVEPVLNRIAPLVQFKPDMPQRTLYHAGPPFSIQSDIPLPIRNSIAAAASLERWTDNDQDALAQLDSGDIQLLSAQDNGLVTPLSFVVGPSTWCIEVIDNAKPDTSFLCPLNDGPPPDGLRFGKGSPAGRALVNNLNDLVAPELARHLEPGTPLLTMFADAIMEGDDLHGHLAALQSHLLEMFTPGLSTETLKYITNANQFVLNIVMAAAALMLQSGSDIDDSDMIVACGGNGVMLGYKLAGHGNKWFQLPANPPVGQKFPHTEQANALPAIGDSAVIDALGFGAANLRFCSTLQEALTGKIDPVFFTDAAHMPFIGPHPKLPLPGLRVGLDLTQPRECLGIMLGMVDADGTSGLIGRGVSAWP